jgi:hypothetical protein
LHGQAYIAEAEGSVFAAMDVATRALLLSGFDVIIDETSTTETTILRYLKIDPNAVPVFIDGTEEECIQRALATDKPYLVEPIKRMGKQLQKLTADWPGTWKRLCEYVAMRQQHDLPA